MRAVREHTVRIVGISPYYLVLFYYFLAILSIFTFPSSYFTFYASCLIPSDAHRLQTMQPPRRCRDSFILLLCHLKPGIHISLQRLIIGLLRLCQRREQ